MDFYPRLWQRPLLVPICYLLARSSYHNPTRTPPEVPLPRMVVRLQP